MPTAPSTPKASVRTNTNAESPAKTPRKSPHCKTCGRPRKGHPLRACESADSSPLKDTTPSLGGHPKGDPTTHIIDAMTALRLAERDRMDKRERRRSAQVQRPMQSLASISTFTGEILESLKAPGVLDDDGSELGDDPEKRDIVIRWRETSGLPASKAASQRSSPIPPRSTSTAKGDSAPCSPDESTPTKKRRAGK
ncbi:hypothetical protein B0H15DRAFT_928096 [Mycena belliarum]|uniref:Uncharacterized protein n=1 Tax=Mycena belliarum TaxID=1033014 RepID=A0AAD6UH94_9AGAR|nr:hypothetical protein B0H15DRAFT_928096 [Mycena belliae]